MTSSSLPLFPDAASLLDRAYTEMQAGRYAQAETLCREALVQSPENADALALLGGFACARGDWQEAERIFAHAFTQAPARADIGCNYGAVLMECGKLPEAETVLRGVWEAAPSMPEAAFNLANVLYARKQLQESVRLYEQALALAPHYLDARFNLGGTLRDLGRYDDAAECFRAVIAAAPSHAGAHNNLGSVYTEAGLLTEAEACYRTAVRFAPAYAEAWGNLAALLLDQGRNAEADVCFAATPGVHVDRARIESNRLLSMHYDPAFTREEMADAARAWGRAYAPSTRADPPAKRVLKPGERLRVGLVSGDYKNHPVGYFLEGPLGVYDRARLELFLYTNDRREDQTTARLRALADHWRPVYDLDDAEADALIRADSIDLLIDLSGHSALHRLTLFARKPAPVQASWLGYFNSTGVAAIDYLMADPTLVRPGEEHLYVERIQRLPSTYHCFMVPREAPEILPSPAVANGYVTFGCFNKLSKLTPQVKALWAEILRRLPDARLFLKTRALADLPVQARLREEFAALGLAADRLILEGFSPRAQVLDAYRRVDIALDPFPYPGGTTSLEALSMGVPVISRTGDRFVSRVGETFLTALGYPEWVARSDAEYVENAVRLASDIPALAALHAGLRDAFAASPVCDAQGFTRVLEDAFWEMATGKKAAA